MICVVASAPGSVALVPAGADKSGVLQLAQSTWTPSDAVVVRSGFTGTVLSGAKLVMSGAGWITVTALTTLGGAASTNTKAARITKNGTVVETFTTTANSQIYSWTTATFAVLAGDVIGIEYFAGTTWSNDRTVQPGSTNSYFYTTIVPAPAGMTKDGSTQGYSGTTVTQVVGMVAESGSTISGSALQPNGTKTAAQVTAQVSLTGIAYGSVHTVQVFKNGVLIPGATFTSANIYTATAVLTVPTTNVNVTASDLITLWVNTSSTGSATIVAGSGTFVRLN